jgi:hypothetical protein
VLADGVGLGAVGGAGVFADDGGTDSISLSTRSILDPEDPRALGPEFWGEGSEGAGYGLVGGGAVALTGAGSTTWRLSTEATGPEVGQWYAKGLGSGSLGFGALEDLGGDDVYEVDAEVRAVDRVRADDGCGCQGAVAEAMGFGDTPVVMVMASSVAPGVSVLHDVAGNDRYDVAAATEAEAEATDNRRSLSDQSEDVGATASAFSGSPLVFAQGAGGCWGPPICPHPGPSEGTLIDEAGNDVYAVNVGAHATAKASAFLPDVHTEARAVGGGALGDPRLHAYGQGSASGTLKDLGGTDTYRWRNSITAVADPPTEQSVGEFHVGVQGALFGYLFDLDGGASDVFESVPLYPACAGTRGGPYWVDCYLDAPFGGGGVNA